MATDQKLLPCPTCKTTDNLAVYTYESGWQHVECDKCYHFGPGEGSRRMAIKSYNDRVRSHTQPAAGQGERK